MLVQKLETCHCPFLPAGCNFTRVPPIYADSIQFCINDTSCIQAFFFLMNKEHELRVVAGLDSFGAGKDVALGLKSSWNLENIGVWAGNKQEPKDTLEYIHYTHGKKEFRKEAREIMLQQAVNLFNSYFIAGSVLFRMAAG